MRSSDARLIDSPKPVEANNGAAAPRPEPQDPPGWDDSNVQLLNRRKFKDLLEEGFTLEELKGFADDLGISHEDLQGTTRSALARELPNYLQRRRQLPSLVEILNEDGRWQIYNVLDHTGPIDYKG